METPRASTVDLSRRLAVETPEHVTVEFELAGVGSRAGALLIDLIFVSGLYLLVPFLALALNAVVDGAGQVVVFVGLIVLAFIIPWGYFTLFEAFSDGRTPGKRRMGLRVVMRSGHPLTFSASVIRNLIRLLVDIQPFGTFGIGFLFVFFHREHKRLGDLVAGTVVVRDVPVGLDALAASSGAPPPDTVAQVDIAVDTPALTDKEYHFLERALERMDMMDDAKRIRLVHDLAARFHSRFSTRARDPRVFLTEVFDLEKHRRQGKFSARGSTGVGQSVRTAESFVATRQDGWRAFHDLATQRNRKMTGEQVVAFAAQYREVAADLARARTYGVEPRVLHYLERLVSAGHNLLYAARSADRTRWGTQLLRDLPVVLYRQRTYVVVAFLIFIIPGLIGYEIIREQPDLAHEILPAGALMRAEIGASEQAAGRGYAETPEMFLPIVATGIIANNVKVAFAGFALGVTAGVGTILVLLFNGLFFGAVISHFANVGLAGWIGTFVAAHGVLELFAIFVAGAGGLVLAKAVVAPGQLPRWEALVSQGQVAIRLLAISVAMLLLAGTIEGLLSASSAPPFLKIGVSAATGVLIWLYLLAGRSAADARSTRPVR